MLPKFVEEIMKYQSIEEEKSGPLPKDPHNKVRTKLLSQLQKLFSYMILSNRKYVDASEVIKSLLDEYGNPIFIGDQKDAGEFNSFFLDKIDECFRENIKNIQKAIQPNNNPQDNLIKTFITHYFLGMVTIILHTKEKDGSSLTISNENTFGSIMANSNENNIYDACEANYTSDIEGYRTKQGHVTRARQECWITKLPAVLLIQLQRVCYDKEAKCTKKNSNPVKFEKVMFMDRFMIENKEISSAIRSQVQEFKSRIKTLEQTISKYKHYGSLKQNINGALTISKELLQSQKSIPIIKEGDIMQVFNPNEIGDLGIQKSNIENAIYVLAAFELGVKTRIAKMEQQIGYYREQIELCYLNMRKYPYRLHSVLMHAGESNSGHFYAFIYDFEQNKWRKYSDTQITEENEENVFKEAMGEINASAQAYCFVYVSMEEDMRVKSSKIAIREYSLVEPQNPLVKDYYTSLVPFKIYSEVMEDNVKFRTELINFIVDEILKTIENTYSSRLVYLLQIKENHQYFDIYRTMNFISFLEYQKIPTFKWQLVESIIAEKIEQRTDQEKMQIKAKVIDKLKDTFMKHCKNAPESLILSDSEIQMLNSFKELYRKEMEDFIVSNYICEKLATSSWKSAALGVFYFFNSKIYMSTESKNNIIGLSTILGLRMCSYVSELFMQNKIQEAIETTVLISQLCLFYIREDKPIVEHISKLLQYLYKESTDRLSFQQKEIVENTLEKLLNKNVVIQDVPLNVSLEVNITS